MTSRSSEVERRCIVDIWPGRGLLQSRWCSLAINDLLTCTARLWWCRGNLCRPLDDHDLIVVGDQQVKFAKECVLISAWRRLDDVMRVIVCRSLRALRLYFTFALHIIRRS
ncbi:hypothetical protein L484_014906 [Morus notabilis]|uniref:Uncharacterized protein n=1 Tax=Morus notabilis TaxID=981085 RepID=W9RMG0_9ROSA|nr:hypothetical protein L484_014906 [Morus notabilis]